MKHAVTLVKEKKKLKNGAVEYWVMRWRGQNGKFHSKSIGRADQVSKRQALKIKRLKEAEFDRHPGRRDASKTRTLSQYLGLYFDARKHELAPGTYEVQEKTREYLEGYFGKDKRIDRITRIDAKAFKAALANGKLKKFSKSPRDLKAATVDTHIRNARTMFNHAVDDEVVLYNPFDRLSKTPTVDRRWHYLTSDEYRKLVDHATAETEVLIALCRLAALRRGEALALEWIDIDWQNNRLQVIAKKDWQPKDRDPRIIPICPELQAILLEAYENAQDGQARVITNLEAKKPCPRLLRIVQEVRRHEICQTLPLNEKVLHT